MTSNELISRPQYRSFLDHLEQRLAQPVGRTPLEEGLTDFYDYSMQLAGLDGDRLLTIIEQQPQAILNYICAKLDTFSEPEGGEDNIVDEPLPVTLPLGHLIEFSLLGEDDRIADYLKQLRIPKAKQYQKQITALFSSSTH